MVYFLCKAYDSDRQNCYFARSLPVRGAWIEISISATSSKFPPSLPVRGAWIEMYFRSYFRITASWSLPVRGAWIEMRTRLASWLSASGRSPCGERGLKCWAFGGCTRIRRSLPVRGAWIEMIPSSPRFAITRSSLPVRGAWIEICPDCGKVVTRPSRSPCGERGLKSFRQKAEHQ